mmetsp:Transcript_64546/g.166124  ORF Transcript_64546/g.166124 Transcript_64546/m.166124 type:complete len:380 (+) Transcript_64546:1602-2741(+)
MLPPRPPGQRRPPLSPVRPPLLPVQPRPPQQHVPPRLPPRYVQPLLPRLLSPPPPPQLGPWQRRLPQPLPSAPPRAPAPARVSGLPLLSVRPSQSHPRRRGASPAAAALSWPATGAPPCRRRTAPRPRDRRCAPLSHYPCAPLLRGSGQDRPLQQAPPPLEPPPVPQGLRGRRRPRPPKIRALVSQAAPPLHPHPLHRECGPRHAHPPPSSLRSHGPRDRRCAPLSHYPCAPLLRGSGQDRPLQQAPPPLEPPPVPQGLRGRRRPRPPKIRALVSQAAPPLHPHPLHRECGPRHAPPPPSPLRSHGPCASPSWQPLAPAATHRSLPPGRRSTRRSAQAITSGPICGPGKAPPRARMRHPRATGPAPQRAARSRRSARLS